jgi:hypothetical protein
MLPGGAFTAAFSAPNQVRQLIELVERTRSSSPVAEVS